MFKRFYLLVFDTKTPALPTNFFLLCCLFRFSVSHFFFFSLVSVYFVCSWHYIQIQHSVILCWCICRYGLFFLHFGISFIITYAMQFNGFSSETTKLSKLQPQHRFFKNVHVFVAMTVMPRCIIVCVRVYTERLMSLFRQYDRSMLN